MEVCQTGYYTEDFRTQEVPAGFDFASYGEFRASLLHQDSFDKRFKLSAMSCPDRRELRVLCFFPPECLHGLFPLNLSGWRTEEIFAQTVSSHLSELSQGDLDTRGAFSLKPRGCVRIMGGCCACVYVWIMLEWAEVGKDRAVRLKTLPSLSSLILSSRLPPPTDLEPPSPSPSLHHYSVTLPPLAFPPLSSSPSLPCFLQAGSIHWAETNPVVHELECLVLIRQ